MSKKKLDMTTPAKRGRYWTKTLYSVQEKIISDWKLMAKAWFRRRSTNVPNLIDELGPAKDRRLNQFGTAVLIRCGNVVKFDKVCRIIRHLSGN